MSSRDTRYKDTLLYGDRAFGSVQGLFRVPPEFASTSGEWATYVVRDTDIGAMDRVAASKYGDGMEWAWWAILMANGIVDPEREMYPGMKIKMPPLQVIQRFTSRGAIP